MILYLTKARFPLWGRAFCLSYPTISLPDILTFRPFLNYFFDAIAPRVLFVSEILFNFVVLSGILPCSRHIESVFAVLCRKSDSFTKQKDNRTTPISCIAMWLCSSLHIPHILFKCGALYRLFLLGFCQNLLLSKRKLFPHFLCILNGHFGNGDITNVMIWWHKLPAIF